jgi:NAD(P)H-dependent flavin oxidoreductase YrpB (nitropropane dioxygenase family)
MNKFKLQHVPIILAGSVWNLKDFEEYIDNPEIGKIAFQFGTRPLLTQEYLKANPQWKNKLRDIQE